MAAWTWDRATVVYIGLFGVPVRMESKLKLVVLAFDDRVELREWVGSSWMELEEGDVDHADA